MTKGLPVYSAPLSEFIMFVALPNNFKLPMTLRPYDGNGDPQVHVTMFRSMMLVDGAIDPFFYWTFPTFLEKVALLWFSSLLAGLIHDFVELSQAFVNHFSSSRVYKKTLNSLNMIWQGPQEPLREYLDRFNAVAMQIQDLILAMKLHSIKKELWAGPFVNSLVITLPRTMAKFRERVVRYINMEEARETRKAKAPTENGKTEDSR